MNGYYFTSPVNVQVAAEAQTERQDVFVIALISFQNLKMASRQYFSTPNLPIGRLPLKIAETRGTSYPKYRGKVIGWKKKKGKNTFNNVTLQCNTPSFLKSN